MRSESIANNRYDRGCKKKKIPNKKSVSKGVIQKYRCDAIVRACTVACRVTSKRGIRTADRNPVTPVGTVVARTIWVRFAIPSRGGYAFSPRKAADRANVLNDWLLWSCARHAVRRPCTCPRIRNTRTRIINSLRVV